MWPFMNYKMCKDETKPNKNLLHFLQAHKKNSLSDIVGKTITMATISVLKHSTTSELSSNIWVLGTFLKYKLAVTF